MQQERDVPVVDTHFSYRDVARIFGLKESRLRYWAQTGFINPSAKHKGRRLYAFADLVEIKAAKELLDHGIPLQRVRRNLRALREALPGAAPNLLGRLRVRSDGEQMVVVDGETALDPISRQMFLDFEIRDFGEEVAEVLRLRHEPAPGARAARAAKDRTPEEQSPDVSAQSEQGEPSAEDRSAYGWFLKGLSADADPEREEQALRAYERAVEIDPGLAAGHTNMGNIYHRRGDRSAALRCYEMACALDPDQPEARYNLANVYEEEGDLDMSIAEYRRALKLAPDFADAHFNLALTLEQVGGRHQAMQHWRRYLELTSSGEGASSEREIAQRHLAKLKRPGA